MSTELAEKIGALKESLRDLWDEEDKVQDDCYLLQWLKVSKMNVKNAEGAMRSSFTWRKENNVHALELEDFPQPLVQGNPFVWDFESVTGAPVCYVREDDMGLAGFLRLYGKDLMVRFITLQLLRMENLVTNYNHQRIVGTNSITVDSAVSLTAVFDGEGYGLRHVASFKVLHLYYEVAGIFSKYFAAFANTGYFLKANPFALVSLRLIRPLLEGPHTTIKVFGTNRATWEPDVYKVIHPETFRALQDRVRARNESYKAKSLDKRL